MRANRMVTVYIASPYTKGDVAMNVKAQIDCADKLISFGFAPFVPLYSHFQHMHYPRPYDVWTRIDREWVLRCDCLLRLEGESKGADAEVALATKNNIPVFYSMTELLNWRQA